MIREEIKKIIEKTIKKLQREGKLPDFELPEIKIEHPKNETHGDYSTGVAFKIADIIGRNPQEISGMISEEINRDLPVSYFTSKVHPFA
jgi:arginyl-tRNA synthetase